MRRTALFLLAGAVFVWPAYGQTSASAQTNASANAQVNGSQAGAGAQSSTSASASQQSESPDRKEGRSARSSKPDSDRHSHSDSTNDESAIQLASGTSINAVLAKSLDARKCKPGDRIEARTTSDVKQDGRVVIKKGSRLYGHVTEAQARTKGHAESSLGMAFDSVALRDGRQVPLHLGVQALAGAWSNTSASLGGDEAMMDSGAGGMAGGGGRAGGGLVGGTGGVVGGAAGLAGGVAGNAGAAAGRAGQMANGTVGATSHATGSAAGNAGGLDAAGHLMSSSSGVYGLQGLQLTSAASSATEGSVVASNTRNVHLDSGTQMVLSAAKQ